MPLTIKDLYWRIEQYHKDLGYDRASFTKSERMEDFRNNALALMMEVSELVDSVPWKPWRDLKDQKLDKDNATREVVDILFFLVGLCETLQISSTELEDKFYRVLGNNQERLKNGYSKKMTEGGDADGE